MNALKIHQAFRCSSIYSLIEIQNLHTLLRVHENLKKVKLQIQKRNNLLEQFFNFTSHSQIIELVSPFPYLHLQGPVYFYLFNNLVSRSVFKTQPYMKPCFIVLYRQIHCYLHHLSFISKHPTYCIFFSFKKYYHKKQLFMQNGNMMKWSRHFSLQSCSNRFALKVHESIISSLLHGVITQQYQFQLK